MNYHYLPIYALTLVLAISYYLGYIAPIIFLIFVIASIFTYLIYAKDKQAAKNDEWRTSEATLHLYSLFCGWPGAIVAQQKLRHKSKKQRFRVVFMFTVILNTALLAGIHSHDGSKMLRRYTQQLDRYTASNVEHKQIKKGLSFLLTFRDENK